MAERISRFLWSRIAGEDFRGVQQEVTQLSEKLGSAEAKLEEMRKQPSISAILREEWQKSREFVERESERLLVQIGEIDEQIKNLKVQLEGYKIEEGEFVPGLREAEDKLKVARQASKDSADRLYSLIGSEIGTDSLDDVVTAYHNSMMHLKRYGKSLFDATKESYRPTHSSILRGNSQESAGHPSESQLCNIQAVRLCGDCSDKVASYKQQVQSACSTCFEQKRLIITRKIEKLESEAKSLRTRRNKLIDKLASLDGLVESFRKTEELRQSLAESEIHGPGVHPAPTVNQSVVTQVHVTTVSNDQVAASNGPAPGYSLVSTLSSCFCCHTAASLRNTDPRYEVLNDDPGNVHTPPYDMSAAGKDTGAITFQPSPCK